MFGSKTGKILSFILLNLLHRFQPNLAHRQRPRNSHCGWSRYAPNESKMANGRLFEKKTVKSPDLCNRVTDFDEIWHDDAYRPITADQPLKFRIFYNPRLRQQPSWKITKIAISPQRFDRSLRHLVW